MAKRAYKNKALALLCATGVALRAIYHMSADLAALWLAMSASCTTFASASTFERLFKGAPGKLLCFAGHDETDHHDMIAHLQGRVSSGRRRSGGSARQTT